MGKQRRPYPNAQLPTVFRIARRSGQQLASRFFVVPSETSNGAELARLNIPQSSFFLIRPDGNIGLCGTRLNKEALESYFANNSITLGAPLGKALAASAN